VLKKIKIIKWWDVLYQKLNFKLIKLNFKRNIKINQTLNYLIYYTKKKLKLKLVCLSFFYILFFFIFTIGFMTFSTYF
jgi:hypothetical protein